MFQKVLVANRGEIASRIIRTLNRLNIRSIAVYSEADKDSLFIHEADETYCIGEPQAQKSYLNMEKILSVAKEAKADAIHPGYGFLSENADFAKACEEQGLIFIGPKSDSIRSMGNKIEARRLMQGAKVPVVPGWHGNLENLIAAKEVAKELGYPVMLKASAGGGGIGMTIVQNEGELEEAFDSSRRRAEMYFGNGDLFLEKWIKNPRHIEVQIACDHEGNAVHLFERECSIQRRHQKVIEESPSPALSNEIKEKLFEAAMRGAKKIGYENVGTMEFIFDEQMNFYFLEMNTRLQVEHPVTEETTKLDLVELQLKIAAGQTLEFSQEDISQSGHAIECRVYAEDPVRFFPSPGTLKTLILPSEGARLDFGVKQGDVVTPFYDPMIGKVITFGKTRDEAVEKMKESLVKMSIEGVKTNLPLLLETMNDERFIEGNYTTSFLHVEKV